MKLYFDARGNITGTCESCGGLAPFGELIAHKVPDGEQTIFWDRRPKTPTGGRFCGGRRWGVLDVPVMKTVVACQKCRFKEVFKK